MGGTERSTARLDHVGLTVSDLASSTAFYRDVVDMRVITTSRPRRHGRWFEILTERSGGVVQSAFLRLGDFTLQLVQYPESEAG